MTDHFIARAVERIGITPAEAATLAEELRAAILSVDVRFVTPFCRYRRGRTVWRFRAGDHWFYAVATANGALLTVLPPGVEIRRAAISKRRKRKLPDMQKETRT